jgi:hypothetical protein
MVEERRFKAFISYSHSDELFASKLHKDLESYRVPKKLRGTAGRFGDVPARLFPIFRDREELPASGSLPASIEDALRRSDVLLVICSPAAAQSSWVAAEIQRFQELSATGRIICAILSGEPNAEPARTIEQECFPARLRAAVAEPLAADFRDGKDGYTLAKLKIIAGLLGLDLELLRQREKEAERQRMTVRSVVGAGIALSIGAASFFGWQAVRQESIAKQEALRLQRSVAEMFSNAAVKRMESGDELGAIRLAAAGHALHSPIGDAPTETLRTIFATAGGGAVVQLPFAPAIIQKAGDAPFYLVISEGGEMVLLDATTLAVRAKGQNKSEPFVEDYDGGAPRLPTPISADGASFGSFASKEFLIQRTSDGGVVHTIPTQSVMAAKFIATDEVVLLDNCVGRIVRSGKEVASYPAPEAVGCGDGVTSTDIRAWKDFPFFFDPSLAQMDESGATGSSDCQRAGMSIADFATGKVYRQSGYCNAAGKLRDDYRSIAWNDASLTWVADDGAAASPELKTRLQTMAAEVAGQASQNALTDFEVWLSASPEDAVTSEPELRLLPGNRLASISATSDSGLFERLNQPPSNAVSVAVNCSALKSVDAAVWKLLDGGFKFPKTEAECSNPKAVFSAVNALAASENTVAFGKWAVTDSGGGTAASIALVQRKAPQAEWRLAYKSDRDMRKLGFLDSDPSSGVSLWALIGPGANEIVVHKSGVSISPIKLSAELCPGGIVAGPLEFLGYTLTGSRLPGGDWIISCQDEKGEKRITKVVLGRFFSEGYISDRLSSIPADQLRFTESEMAEPAFSRLSPALRETLVKAGLLAG